MTKKESRLWALRNIGRMETLGQLVPEHAEMLSRITLGVKGQDAAEWAEFVMLLQLMLPMEDEI